jgi:hypothetical protein
MSDLFHGLIDGRALLVVFLSLAWHAVSPQYRRAGQCVFDCSDEGKQERNRRLCWHLPLDTRFERLQRSE